MRYNVIIRKKIKYVRVYTILNRIGPKYNILTRFLMRLASKLVKNEDKNI